MNCQDVKDLLLAYLDDEAAPSERVLAEAHLNGCEACQQELAELSALQSRVGQFLRSRAARAAPSPQAWDRLRARLTEASPEQGEGKARPSLSWVPAWFRRLAPGAGRANRILERGVKMRKKGLALAAAVALAALLGVMAFVPSVRAQVGEFLRWFRFESPAGGGEVSITGSVEFTPLRPSYLPEGFQAMAVGLNPETASLNYWNSRTDQILVIDEYLTRGDDPLPLGADVTINGQPAALITGLEGEVGFVLLLPTLAAPITPTAGSDQVALEEPLSAPDETVSYTDGRQLIWYVGPVRIEMLSNLPLEEMLRIAESMVPAETDEGPTEPNP